MTEPMLERIRLSLGSDEKANGQTLARPRPAIIPSRWGRNEEAEIEQFLGEIKKLSGSGKMISVEGIEPELRTLVANNNIRKAVLWNSQRVNQLMIADILNKLGVEIVPSNADKYALASCDLGVTEADYLLPETGTLVLRSSADRPRGVSLIPRFHLAIVAPEMIRADMHQVFTEAKESKYLVFITGPSRTADIELTVTLGVHGPKNLMVWIIEK